jgi:hypothetical protein
MKKLLAALFVLALCSSIAMGSVPDPDKCTVLPNLNDGCLICPGNPSPINGTTYTVTVRNNNNDLIPDAVVEFQFDANIGICDDAQHTVTATAGVAIVTLKGGGCVTTGGCDVKANGQLIHSFTNCKSPDNGANHASFPDGDVGIGDIGPFGDEFNGPEDDCHDYDNTGTTDVGDIGFFGDAFSAHNVCTLLP